MNNASPDPALIERICSLQFVDECPRYIAYAEALLHRVGLGERRDTMPGRAQAEVVLADAVVVCLSGQRVWGKDVEFFTFFCGTMRSTLSSEINRIRREREVWGEVDGEPAAPPSRRDARIDARHALAEAREVLEGDPRTKEMLDAIDDGAEKPSDLVEKLGWTPQQAKAVRVVASRRLDAAGLRKDKKERRC